MTIRQAVIESMKRMGITDIQERLDFSDMTLPEGKRIAWKTIPKGKEEELIRELVTVYTKINNDPKLKQDYLDYVDRLEQERNQNQ